MSPKYKTEIRAGRSEYNHILDFSLLLLHFHEYNPDEEIKMMKDMLSNENLIISADVR